MAENKLLATDKEYNTLRARIQLRINETYNHDIEENISERSRCRKLGHICEGISQILALGGTILAFAAGFYDNKTLSFIAGSLGSLSLATTKTAAFALKESNERTTALNTILKKIHITGIPEIQEE